jgi:hypothetical protein
MHLQEFFTPLLNYMKNCWGTKKSTIHDVVNEQMVAIIFRKYAVCFLLETGISCTGDTDELEFLSEEMKGK